MGALSFPLLRLLLARHLAESMEKRPRGRAKDIDHHHHHHGSEEVSSSEWEFIDMSDEEVDIICRMYRLVGDRWEMIAGRVPGRTPEAIERYWKMRHEPCFAERRLKRRTQTRQQRLG
ncbi:transcription factor CPC-like [Musa acuminata AAA Group]|uniref:transcription factor CPC-like n=1 Tax=Musa acuminata AAA Group TaxID=214697 RepID=UPI0031D484F8